MMSILAIVFGLLAVTQAQVYQPYQPQQPRPTYPGYQQPTYRPQPQPYNPGYPQPQPRPTYPGYPQQPQPRPTYPGYPQPQPPRPTYPQQPGMPGMMPKKMMGMPPFGICALCAGKRNDPICGMEAIPKAAMKQVKWVSCRSSCIMKVTPDMVFRGCADTMNEAMMKPGVITPPKAPMCKTCKMSQSTICMCGKHGCNKYGFGEVSGMQWMKWEWDPARQSQVCIKNPCYNGGQCRPNPQYMQAFQQRQMQMQQKMGMVQQKLAQVKSVDMMKMEMPPPAPKLSKQEVQNMMQKMMNKQPTVLPFQCVCPQGFSGTKCGRDDAMWAKMMAGKNQTMPGQPTYPQQPGYPQQPTRPTYPQQPQQPTYPQRPTVPQQPTGICARRPQPCQNQGQCQSVNAATNGGLPFRCLCPPNWQGTVCHIPKTAADEGEKKTTKK